MKDLTVQTEQRMTSIEIAGLTGKAHKNVMRDIRVLLAEGAINGPKVELVKYKDKKGENRPMYSLDFKSTMTLVTGYDAVRRAKVIDRWIDLEEQIKHRDPVEILSDPEAMRGILLTYTEKVIKLEARLEKQTPTVEAFDKIASADGLTCITDTAKSLQLPRIKDLFDWMSANQWIYRRPGGKGWLAYQERIQQGVLYHKVTTTCTSDGREKVIEQVLVTPKGLTNLAKVFRLEATN